jgi:hypothetical protein
MTVLEHGGADELKIHLDTIKGDFFHTIGQYIKQNNETPSGVNAAGNAAAIAAANSSHQLSRTKRSYSIMYMTALYLSNNDDDDDEIGHITDKYSNGMAKINAQAFRHGMIGQINSSIAKLAADAQSAIGEDKSLNDKNRQIVKKYIMDVFNIIVSP